MKIWKNSLGSDKVRTEAQNKGLSKGCGRKHCKICKVAKDSESFESISWVRALKLREKTTATFI